MRVASWMRTSSSLAMSGSPPPLPGTRYELSSLVSAYSQASRRTQQMRRLRCFLAASTFGRACRSRWSEDRASVPGVGGVLRSATRRVKVPFDRLQLPCELQNVQLSPNAGEQLVRVDRLGEEFANAVLHPLEPRVHV